MPHRVKSLPIKISRIIGGIQLADLAAHSLGVMLLEHQYHNKKMVKAGENSGYDPNLDIELVFKLWASLRYAFFKAPQPINSPEDPLSDRMFDVENYGLYIAETCDEALREASNRAIRQMLSWVHSLSR